MHRHTIGPGIDLPSLRATAVTAGKGYLDTFTFFWKIRSHRDHATAEEGREMANLVARNLAQRFVDALKQRADRHGRSAEAEHRAILEEVL
jgi:hypothetical protein